MENVGLTVQVLLVVALLIIEGHDALVIFPSVHMEVLTILYPIVGGKTPLLGANGSDCMSLPLIQTSILLGIVQV
jgi:hypothetical protein